MNSRHITVQDLMTCDVVRADPQTPLKDVATMLARHHIAAVPVVDGDDRAIGVVSEADLMRHEAVRHDPYGREKDLPRTGRGDRDAETVGELMTTPVVTGKPYWNVVEAARTMDRHQVNQLPVIGENGRLVGVLSRSDLMRVFLRSDEAIRSEITREVVGRILAIRPGEIRVEVDEGVVTLRGKITRPRIAPVLVRLCGNVDGVVAVHDRLHKPQTDVPAEASEARVSGSGQPTQSQLSAWPWEQSTKAAVAETHTAAVFFLGDRAYKVKKPVDLGFLDFTTRSARRAACERELELNRRFAPDVYLGLAELSDPSGEAPEPLVVMRRMPASRRLSHLVSVGAPAGDALRDVARLLATHHAGARTDEAVRAEGTRDALLGRWETGLEQIRPMVDDDRSARDLDEIERLVHGYLAGRRPLFEARIRQGRVVEGHGDLLAQDIYCLDDGPRILDCLEFDDRLRYVDGLDDAAFLAMDLERLGAPEAAAEFLSKYREFSGDPAPASLWHHYIAYRAFVRAKVSLIQSREGASGAPEAAADLIAIVLRHLRASVVRLVLVGGLPASGKSTVAGALADRLETSLLSTDRLRKELLGRSPQDPAPAGYREGIYAPDKTRHTYEVLLERAADLLREGEPVVLDATWNSIRDREAAVRVARRTDAELVALRCEVPEDVARLRLDSRPPGPSDAGPEVAEAMAADSDPWPEAVTIDTTAPVASAVRRAASAVRGEDSEIPQVHRFPYMDPG